jgi:hypothetical protein
MRKEEGGVEGRERWRRRRRRRRRRKRSAWEGDVDLITKAAVINTYKGS